MFAHSVCLFGVSLCSVLFPMVPVSLGSPFMFAHSVYLFGVSLCSVLFPMERQNKEKHQTNKPNGQTWMDNTETQAPLGTRQNKEKHQTNNPKGQTWMDNTETQAPLGLPLRVICLVFLFVLSYSQWSLCLCVVHSCLPFGLFVWCFSLFCLVPNGDWQHRDTGSIENKTEQRETPNK
jgi:hypothetical protein